MHLVQPLVVGNHFLIDRKTAELQLSSFTVCDACAMSLHWLNFGMMPVTGTASWWFTGTSRLRRWKSRLVEHCSEMACNLQLQASALSAFRPQPVAPLSEPASQWQWPCQPGWLRAPECSGQVAIGHGISSQSHAVRAWIYTSMWISTCT